MNHDDTEMHERFTRMLERIHICIAEQRPFVDIAQVISDGLTSPVAAQEWPDIVLEDILDAELVGE